MLQSILEHHPRSSYPNGNSIWMLPSYKDDFDWQLYYLMSNKTTEKIRSLYDEFGDEADLNRMVVFYEYARELIFRLSHRALTEEMIFDNLENIRCSPQVGFSLIGFGFQVADFICSFINDMCEDIYFGIYDWSSEFFTKESSNLSVPPVCLTDTLHNLDELARDNYLDVISKSPLLSLPNELILQFFGYYSENLKKAFSGYPAPVDLGYKLMLDFLEYRNECDSGKKKKKLETVLDNLESLYSKYRDKDCCVFIPEFRIDDTWDSIEEKVNHLFYESSGVVDFVAGHNSDPSRIISNSKGSQKRAVKKPSDRIPISLSMLRPLCAIRALRQFGTVRRAMEETGETIYTTIKAKTWYEARAKVDENLKRIMGISELGFRLKQ